MDNKQKVAAQGALKAGMSCMVMPVVCDRCLLPSLPTLTRAVLGARKTQVFAIQDRLQFLQAGMPRGSRRLFD